MTPPDLHEVQTIFSAVSILFLILLFASWVRRRSTMLSRLLLPGSVVAGFALLLLGPDGLGAIVRTFSGPDALLAGGIVSADIASIWRSMPSLLINIVFACLFLGKAIPNPREIWAQSAPIVCYGQTIAWGQYVLGMVLAIAVLTPLFGLDPMVGALIEIGFEGGHGTAAGLGPVFDSLGFEEGLDLALGLASVGLISAILSGVFLVNWARRNGMLIDQSASTAVQPAENVTTAPAVTLEDPEKDDNPPIDPLSFTLGLVAASVALGVLLLEALQWVERITWGKNGLVLLAHVPLFPMAMIGGAVVQSLVQRIWSGSVVSQLMIKRISGVSLDLIIVSALGTLSLGVIIDNLAPFLILAIAGTAFNIAGFLYLAPRLIPDPWFERGIPNFGQSMGMTVTGLMLFQMADPKNQSGGLERFGYKQLLFEPVVGGGVFTAMSLPLIVELGPVAFLALTLGVMTLWLVLGFCIARRGQN